MTELVVPEKSRTGKESIQPNKIACNEYCRALTDFSYLHKEKQSCKWNATNQCTECEMLEIAEETSLSTKWLFWSNKSKKPVNWSNSGFRHKHCARQFTMHAMKYHSDTVYVHGIQIQLSNERKEKSTKVSHFKRRQCMLVSTFIKRKLQVDKRVKYCELNETQQRVNKLL